MEKDTEKGLGVPVAEPTVGPNAAPLRSGPSDQAANVPHATQADQLAEDDWYDDTAEEVIIGYECLGCGNTQDTNGWGGRCNTCDGLSLEPMYY